MLRVLNMRRLFFAVLTIFVASGTTAQSHGAQEELKADDPTTFGVRANSVVVARVRKVAKIADRRIGTHTVTLEPLVTLAGAFDPTAEPELKVRLWAEWVGSSIQRAPPIGAMVVAVIGEGPVLGGPDTFMYAVSEICDFMPEGSGMVVVENLADKRVQEIIDKIRAGRARAKAILQKEFQKAPTTRPAPTRKPK
jgi:hypothetical protein